MDAAVKDKSKKINKIMRLIVVAKFLPHKGIRKKDTRKKTRSI